MAESVLDVFNLLGELSGDSIFADRVRMGADQVLVDKKGDEDRRLAKIYQDSEAELIKRGKGKYSHEEIRRQAAAALAQVKGDHQAFRLLFLPSEPQLIALASALVAAFSDRSRLCFGPRVTAKIVGACLADTPWKEVQITPDQGIAYNALRMRSLSECGEIVATLFDRWYEASRVLLGDEATRKLFRQSYLDVDTSFGFLPMMKNLLGLTPREVMWADKVKRLHDLEAETIAQAKDIRAADADLSRQARQLQQTVDELEETRRRLETVSQARSEFIDVVAHQFRTPLSSIRWNGELLTDALSEKRIDGEFADAIATVRQRSVYLIETLDRVFATLEIETGKLVVDKKPAFLWEAVQDVYGQMEKDIAYRGLKWKFQRSKEQPRAIPMDKTKVAAVLKILIGNAVVYNKEGGKVSVSIADKKIDGLEYQVCEIEDEGLGLSKEDQARVFDKFFRAKPAVLKVADGTGLGMFIVKHFIEAQHGLVRVESDGEGKGTLVAFALPVK